MSTKQRPATRLSLVTQLTSKVTEQIAALENELSQLLNDPSSTSTISEEDWLLSQLADIRLQLEILDLKERYLTRANHRLRQRVKHINHQRMHLFILKILFFVCLFVSNLFSSLSLHYFV